MITIKTKDQINNIKYASKVLSEALYNIKKIAKPGVNCLELNNWFLEYIKSNNCESNFKGYYGFPGAICISINEQLVHGIPQDRILKKGDIVSIDAGCKYNNYHSDSAITFICGDIANNTKDDILIKVTEKSLNLAIDNIKPGVRIGTIGSIIQKYVESFNFHLPKDYVGHGIGLELHEDPMIPNYGTYDTGIRLQENMVICIEPMVQIGTDKTYTSSDKWTVYSADHSMAAHFEHTILVTKDGCEVLTRRKDEVI